MNISNIKFVDIADGIGCRTTIFVSGCRRHCKGCQNPNTWNFNNGIPYTEEMESKILESMKDYWIKGLTICGGEPFEPENEEILVKLAARFKYMYGDIYTETEGYGGMKDIWAYSGYTYEELHEKDRGYGLLRYIDVLVDGPFIEDLKDVSIRFRGSSNQRILKLFRGKVIGEIK